MSNKFWAYEYKNAETWCFYEECETKEQAIKCGLEWARERQLEDFNIGKCAPIPLPTELDVVNIFEYLDECYINDAENPDADGTPFCDSITEENKEAQKRLIKNISAAIEKYIEDAKVSSSWYRIENIETINVLEKLNASTD